MHRCLNPHKERHFSNLHFNGRRVQSEGIHSHSHCTRTDSVEFYWSNFVAFGAPWISHWASLYEDDVIAPNLGKSHWNYLEGSNWGREKTTWPASLNQVDVCSIRIFKKLEICWWNVWKVEMPTKNMLNESGHRAARLCSHLPQNIFKDAATVQMDV